MTGEKTPLEVVEEIIIEVRDRYPRLPTDAPSAELAEEVFKALKENGYVIARARVQWRH